MTLAKNAGKDSDAGTGRITNVVYNDLPDGLEVHMWRDPVTGWLTIEISQSLARGAGKAGVHLAKAKARQSGWHPGMLPLPLWSPGHAAHGAVRLAAAGAATSGMAAVATLGPGVWASPPPAAAGQRHSPPPAAVVRPGHARPRVGRHRKPPDTPPQPATAAAVPVPSPSPAPSPPVTITVSPSPAPGVSAQATVTLPGLNGQPPLQIPLNLNLPLPPLPLPTISTCVRVPPLLKSCVNA
jgi:hypothetical protein